MRKLFWLCSTQQTSLTAVPDTPGVPSGQSCLTAGKRRQHSRGKPWRSTRFAPENRELQKLTSESKGLWWKSGCCVKLLVTSVPDE